MELIEIKESTKQSFLRELFKISHDCINSSPAYSGGAVINDPFQTFLYSKTGRRDHDALLDLYKKTMTSCESRFANAAQASLLICEDLHSRKIYDIDAVERFLESDHLSKKKRLKKEDLKNMWSSSVEIESLSPDWIDNLKIDSSFECKLTKASSSKIVVQKGHNFKNIRLHESFHAVGRISSSDCDLLIVDGIVESEGEIFSLVEKARKSSRQTFLVAAGFSRDVVLHLLKNYLMGSFKVIPLICAVQDDPIGVLVDLSTASGADILSSAKGDTLSGSHERCAVSVKKITTSLSGTIFEMNTHSDSLKRRIEELQSALSVSTGDSQRYISERISSMRGSMIRIFISEFDNSKNPGLVGRIDSFLRSLQPMAKMGIVNISGRDFPTLSVRESLLAFSSFIRCLKSLQVILETE